MNWLNAHGEMEFELRAAVPAANDAFGPIGFRRNRILCGAVGEDTTVADSGAVYVFSRADNCALSWSLAQGPIKASDPANNGFGLTGGIFNDLFVVGAEDADGMGAVYAFRLESGTWVEKQKIQPGDLGAGDKFGSDVKIFDQTIVVGASDQGTGVVYVYVTANKGATWTLEQKITPSAGDAGDKFGIAVSLFVDSLAVGATLDAGPANGTAGSGAVYLYSRTGGVWAEQTILRASDLSASSEFGRSLSMTDRGLAVGAHLEASVASQAGAAYVFQRQASLWTEEAKVIAPDGAIDDFFGRAVALQGDSLLIGAFGRDDFQVDAGTCYVFAKRGAVWEFQSRMEYRAHTGADRMGLQAFLHESDGTAVVGLDGKTGNEGSALVFKPLKSQLFYGSAITNGDGQGVHTDVEGNLAVTSGALPGSSGGTGKCYTLKFNPTTERWVETQVLVGSDSVVGDQFGRSVALDGNQLAVSARERPDGATLRVGALYVFETTDNGDSWVEVAGPLLPPSPALNDRLGNQVTIQGNTLIAGMFTHNSNEGGVEVWKKVAGTWTHNQSIIAPAVGSQFGAFVNLQGNVLAISAAREDGNRGVIYIYKRPNNNSPFVQKLRIFQQSEPQTPGLIWGIPFKLVGDTLAAGGRGSAGRIFIFRTTDNWETFFEEAKIEHPDLEGGDTFGSEVILSRTNNNIMVGTALGDDDYDNGLSGVGVAYLYTRKGNTWTFRRKIRSPNRNLNDFLAADIGAMYGSTLMMCNVFDDGPFNTGSTTGMTLILTLGDVFAPCVPEGDTPPPVELPQVQSDVGVDKFRKPFRGLKLQIARGDIDSVEVKRTINDQLAQAILISKSEYDDLRASAIRLLPKIREDTIPEESFRSGIDTFAENVCGQVLEPLSSRVAEYSKRHRITVKHRVPPDGIFKIGFPVVSGPSVLAKERPSGTLLVIDSVEHGVGVVNFNIAEANKLFELNIVVDDFLVILVIPFRSIQPTLVLLSKELHTILLDLQL